MTQIKDAADLLESYGASLSASDQMLLRTLTKMDSSKGQSLLNLRFLAWGPNAAELNLEHQTVQGMKQQKLEDVLQIFGKDAMKRSIAHFPLHVDLDVDTEVNEEAVLDPRFVLPLMYHLLSPQNLINCHQFVELKGLSYTLVSLSSFSLSVRSLGYAILSRFYQHLESSTFYKERQLWLTFLDSLRCGMTQHNQQLLRIQTSFLTDVVDVLLSPGSIMHEPIRSYLAAVTSFDPEGIMKSLVKLQQSTDSHKHLKYMEWSLMCLAKGLQTGADFEICYSHDLFGNLMALSLSPIVDQNTKMAILKLFEAVLKLEVAVNRLSLENGFTSWLLQEARESKRLTASNDVKNILERIVTNICKTFIVKNKKRLKKCPESEKFVFYSTFVDEMTFILTFLKGH